MILLRRVFFLLIVSNYVVNWQKISKHCASEITIFFYLPLQVVKLFILELK